MVVERQGSALEHRGFGDLAELLEPGTVLVANDSKVFRARLLGTKDSGGRVELLLLEAPAQGAARAIYRASKPLRPGQRLNFEDGVSATVLEASQGRCRVEFAGMTAAAAAERAGQVPLPPYIERAEGPDGLDGERYQTVYARAPGSVAAPTAGLHFSRDLLDALARRGVRFLTLTLDVGPGTFVPVRGSLDEHEMESERFEVPAEVVSAVEEARSAGAPVIAVGTTTVRALESAAIGGRLAARSGRTSLFIRPGHHFVAIDGLITNFHLPGSTLLALVMALGGESTVRRAYAAAVAARYRFYSYGDAMLLR